MKTKLNNKINIEDKFNTIFLRKRNIHQFIINKINNIFFKNCKKCFDNLIISNKINYNVKQAKNKINNNSQTSLSIINLDKNFENEINDFIKNYIKEKEEQIIYNYQPKGLINFTSNCYLNSLLQCLYYIKDFRNYFLNEKFSNLLHMCLSLKDIMKGLKNNNEKNLISLRK